MNPKTIEMTNPYIWIVQYEFRNPDHQWEATLECYESLTDAKASQRMLQRLTANYRRVQLIGRDVQTPQYVARIQQAAAEMTL